MMQVMKENSEWIKETIGRLTTEQKAGQLVILGMNGTVLTPDMTELIRDYHVGGIRISMKARHTTLATLHSYARPGDQHDDMTLKSVHHPAGLCKDLSFTNHPPVLTTGQYAEFLNCLRSYVEPSSGAIPVHFVIDQEGNGTDDLLGGARLFPYPLGLASTNDPELIYRAGLAVGRQAAACGINTVQAVLDVNTNINNPEIGPRSFGNNADDVIRCATQFFRGLKDGGVSAVGKHFAGRGESTADAHWGLPVMDVPLDELENTHIRPFGALAEAGLLPGIMVAHCIYPALGESKLPATLSPRILKDYIRGKMGYRGVLVTDNMMMGGIIKQYEMTDAIIMSLQAGIDMVLCRDESPVRQVILKRIAEAIRSGLLPETEVDEKLARILAMRCDMGLLNNNGLVDSENAEKIVHDPVILETAREAAEKSVQVLRDRAGVLPLAADAKVLLIEQAFVTQIAANNADSHPGLLWEELSRIGRHVACVEIADLPPEADIERVRRRLRSEDFDVIVTTNYFHYKVGGSINGLVDEFIATGKPVIVLANNPFPFCVGDSFDTVLLNYQPAGREYMRATAALIFGK